MLPLASTSLVCQNNEIWLQSLPWQSEWVDLGCHVSAFGSGVNIPSTALEPPRLAESGWIRLLHWAYDNRRGTLQLYWKSTALLFIYLFLKRGKIPRCLGLTVQCCGSFALIHSNHVCTFIYLENAVKSNVKMGPPSPPMLKWGRLVHQCENGEIRISQEQMGLNWGPHLGLQQKYIKNR